MPTIEQLERREAYLKGQERIIIDAMNANDAQLHEMYRHALIDSGEMSNRLWTFRFNSGWSGIPSVYLTAPKNDEDAYMDKISGHWYADYRTFEYPLTKEPFVLDNSDGEIYLYPKANSFKAIERIAATFALKIDYEARDDLVKEINKLKEIYE